MNTASTWRRLAAYWMDSMVLGLCLLPFWFQVWGALVWGSEIAVSWRWLVAGVLLQLFYKWTFLYFMGGTLGKLIMGLRVVPRWDSQADLGLFQSLLRVLTDALSIFFGMAPRALALLRLDRTHISDWVAETRVVQLDPQKQIMRRHWAVALLVIWVSFFGQFSDLYRRLQHIEFEGGQIVLDI